MISVWFNSVTDRTNHTPPISNISNTPNTGPKMNTPKTNIIWDSFYTNIELGIYKKKNKTQVLSSEIHMTHLCFRYSTNNLQVPVCGDSKRGTEHTVKFAKWSTNFPILVINHVAQLAQLLRVSQILFQPRTNVWTSCHICCSFIYFCCFMYEIFQLPCSLM